MFKRAVKRQKKQESDEKLGISELVRGAEIDSDESDDESDDLSESGGEGSDNSEDLSEGSNDDNDDNDNDKFLKNGSATITSCMYILYRFCLFSYVFTYNHSFCSCC